MGSARAGRRGRRAGQTNSEASRGAGVGEPVRLTQEQAARVVAVQASTMGYMSNSFRPKLSSSTETVQFNDAKIPVYRVQNSDFQLYTDNPNPKAKATRTAEKLLRAALPFLPDGFEIPPVLVVDFNAHGLNLDSRGNKHDVIGGFVAELGVMFLNSQYNTYEKILQFVRRTNEQFANQTVFAPVLHELGHKYYYNCIESLAKSKRIGYNKAKEMIDRALFNRIQELEAANGSVKELLSKYADDGYQQQNYTELIAECYTVMHENAFAQELISIVGGDFDDGV